MTEIAVCSLSGQIFIEHLLCVRPVVGVWNSMVNKAAVAPVLKQSASLFIIKPCLYPLHDLISLLDSGCYRISVSEQDLGWHKGMAGFNDRFGAGRSAAHG